MKNLLSLTGSAHEWFRSYLSGRSHRVTIGSSMSESMVIRQGVPQGSVLGLLLFCIYMLPLGSVICKYGLGYHCYADDTQLYVSTTNSNIHKATSLHASCLRDIKAWMRLSFLQLNGGKTEVILLGAKTTLKQLGNISLEIDGVRVLPSTQVHNLGVYLDSKLSFEAHIKHDTKVSFFHLRNIARIRRCLSQPGAERLIHAFISSRLDYCSALLVGATDKNINRLQYVQNCAARLLKHTSPLCSSNYTGSHPTTH